MSELRVAVVGVGRMGLTHAENIVHRTRGAQLVAVTTSSAERAEAVRRCCGAVPVYDNLDRLIESKSLDAVIISSSTSAHVENVERCAAAGLHILCEKPLGLSLEDCDRAVNAVDTAGAFADLGVSGGLILDSMYHDIYLGRWLMDDEIIRVYGEGGALIDDDVGSVGDVDNAVVSARFAGGAMATLTASRTTRYGHDLRGEVIGDEGAVQVGRLQKTPVRWLDKAGAHHDAVFTTPERMGDAFVTMLQSFVDCIVDDTEPPVSSQDGMATLSIAIAARHSIQTGEPVTLDEQPIPPVLGRDLMKKIQ